MESATTFNVFTQGQLVDQTGPDWNFTHVSANVTDNGKI